MKCLKDRKRKHAQMKNGENEGIFQLKAEKE